MHQHQYQPYLSEASYSSIDRSQCPIETYEYKSRSYLPDQGNLLLQALLEHLVNLPFLFPNQALRALQDFHNQRLAGVPEDLIIPEGGHCAFEADHELDSAEDLVGGISFLEEGGGKVARQHSKELSLRQIVMEEYKKPARYYIVGQCLHGSIQVPAYSAFFPAFQLDYPGQLLQQRLVGQCWLRQFQLQKLEDLQLGQEMGVVGCHVEDKLQVFRFGREGDGLDADIMEYKFGQEGISLSAALVEGEFGPPESGQNMLNGLPVVKLVAALQYFDCQFSLVWFIFGGVVEQESQGPLSQLVQRGRDKQAGEELALLQLQQHSSLAAGSMHPPANQPQCARSHAGRLQNLPPPQQIAADRAEGGCFERKLRLGPGPENGVQSQYDGMEGYLGTSLGVWEQLQEELEMGLMVNLAGSELGCGSVGRVENGSEIEKEGLGVRNAVVGKPLGVVLLETRYFVHTSDQPSIILQACKLNNQIIRPKIIFQFPAFPSDPPQITQPNYLCAPYQYLPTQTSPKAHLTVSLLLFPNTQANIIYRQPNYSLKPHIVEFRTTTQLLQQACVLASHFLFEINSNKGRQIQSCVKGGMQQTICQ